MSKLEHEIPEDDFGHKQSLDCDCKPHRQWNPGKGTRVVHKEIKANDLPPGPICVPEEWCEK